jgi:hypothetical protein
MFWVIRSRLIVRLWLIATKRTILEGQVFLNQQPLPQARLILKQSQKTFQQTTTDRHGYYRLVVSQGQYRLHLQWLDRSSPQKQLIKIKPTDYGHILQRDINLVE